MKFKEGDYVKIICRDVTPTDVKGCVYYPHFGGLAGVVDRIYDEEVCLRIDQDTLPQSVLKRHIDIQESIKRKWLNNLSGEARNRLTPEEKRFELAYTILVRTEDLVKAKPGEARPAEIKSVKPLNAPTAGEETPAPKVQAEAPPSVSEKPTAAKPAEPVLKAKTEKPAKPAKAEAAQSVTPNDLEAAEAAFLKEREKALKEKK